MANQQSHYLTEEGLEHLKQELAHLRDERRPAVAKRIHEASESGGTADNAEYDEAKSDQAFVEGRIQELERLISDAVVAPQHKGKREAVDFGSTVTVTNQQGKKTVYRIVGSAESAPLEGNISVESPVGKALMGHKVGDEVEVQVPSGPMKLTITQIR